MRMTDCSLFFRGVNFEVKHVNVFGITDEDMKNYARLQAEDAHEAEISKLAVPAQACGTKGDEDEETKSDKNQDDLNQTRVERMADKSVVHDLKDKGLLPELDFKILVMTKHQLFNHPEFSANCDPSDIASIVGVETLQQEIQGMDN